MNCILLLIVLYTMQGSKGYVGDKGGIGPEGDTLCELHACGNSSIAIG